MSDRYKSRGRKERTPEQLKVLEMAREKARLVIAERTKITREMEEPPPEETEPPTPPPTTTEVRWRAAAPQKYFLCFPYQNDESPPSPYVLT